MVLFTRFTKRDHFLSREMHSCHHLEWRYNFDLTAMPFAAKVAAAPWMLSRIVWMKLSRCFQHWFHAHLLQAYVWNFRYYICNGWYCLLTKSGMLCSLQKTHRASWTLRNVSYSVPYPLWSSFCLINFIFFLAGNEHASNVHVIRTLLALLSPICDYYFCVQLIPMSHHHSWDLGVFLLWHRPACWNIPPLNYTFKFKFNQQLHHRCLEQ